MFLSNLNRKALLLGLASIFFATLFFSYTPTYLSGLGIMLGLNPESLSKPGVSPADTIMNKVTLVTNSNVTNVTLMSPSVTQIEQEQAGIYYTSLPTVESKPDPDKNPLEPASLSPSVSSLVVINEIAWMGTLISANDEWIELFNPTDSPINLEGWTLESKDGTPSVDLSGVIKPRGFYLLERTSDDSVKGISADKIYSGALNNNGEHLELKDKNGNIKDEINAISGWPAGLNPSGSPLGRVSMERINPLDSGLNLKNWGSFQNQEDPSTSIGGTPYAVNSVH